uniref:Fe2OG dioxygenase domain-containing protein n=1 Tax=Strigamia maritima TaxID=126957 RepID=T1J1L3_STRMM
MLIFQDFISKEEENTLLMELEPYLKRMRYEFDHWDNAIHGYRETEKTNWNEENKNIIRRIKKLAFPEDTTTLQHIHVLDITKDGYIKPHIDSVRFCGNIITGISLLSTSVMRLIHEKNPEFKVDVLLPQRSLYIMKNLVRFEYTHQVLADKDSFHRGNHIPRERRISIMCRNEPSIS